MFPKPLNPEQPQGRAVLEKQLEDSAVEDVAEGGRVGGGCFKVEGSGFKALGFEFGI